MKQRIFFTETPERQGWKKNVELCVDVKTYLQGDLRMKAGKGYQGVLRREVVCEDYKYNERLTFVETSSRKRMKRNPHVFEGDHITITRSDDGTYRPNFRPIRIGPGFNVDYYASSVANELLWALEGLVENA